MSHRVVSRLGALSLMGTVSARNCRFYSTDFKDWTEQNFAQRVSNRSPRQHHKVFDEDTAMEDIEDKLEVLLDEEKKWKTAVKFNKIRRQMTPPGAPERMLNWDSIEQIRYLRREQPEEWTVKRLAEGFSVNPDVILRVLRSKFNPAVKRKAKQDAKVMARHGQQAQLPGSGTEQNKLPLPAQNMPSMLHPVYNTNTTGALVSLARQALMPGGNTHGGSACLATQPNLLSISKATISIPNSALTSVSEEDRSALQVEHVGEHTDEDEDNESWDGQVFSEKELEELMLTTKPSPVVQVGLDFYDPKGNFLYRI